MKIREKFVKPVEMSPILYSCSYYLCFTHDCMIVNMKEKHRHSRSFKKSNLFGIETFSFSIDNFPIPLVIFRHFTCQRWSVAFFRSIKIQARRTSCVLSARIILDNCATGLCILYAFQLCHQLWTLSKDHYADQHFYLFSRYMSARIGNSASQSGLRV